MEASDKNFDGEYRIDATGPATLTIPAGMTVSIQKPQKPVGYWILYPDAPRATMFAMYAKPTPEQIENTKAMLGWGWEDAEP